MQALAAAAAAAAVAAVPQPPPTLVEAFTTCGVAAARVQAFADSTGATTLEDLYIFPLESGPKSIIETYHGTLANTAQGRNARVGAVVQARLEALIWLVHDKRKRGQQIQAGDWTPATVNNVIERMRTAAVAKEQASKEPEYENIKTGVGYENWVAKFENDVATQLSSDGVTSMAYLLRRPNAPPLPPTATDHERRTRSAPHTGPAFEIDNTKLYRVLESVTIKEEQAYQFVRIYQSTKHGVNAWTAVINHYEGTAQCLIRVGIAERDIAPPPAGLQWISEYQGMKFNLYAANLRKAYSTLEKNSINHPVRSRVFRLCDGMKITNDQMTLAIAVNHCKTALAHQPNGFDDAIRHIYGQLMLVQPPKAKSSFNKERRISQAGRGRGRGRGREGGGRGGRGGGRGRGHHNSNDQKGFYDAGNRDEWINGVHVTNIWKQNFGDNWDKVKEYINEQRNKANGKRKHAPRDGDDHDSRTAKQVQSDRDGNDDEKEKNDEKGARTGESFMKKKKGRGTYKDDE